MMSALPIWVHGNWIPGKEIVFGTILKNDIESNAGT